MPSKTWCLTETNRPVTIQRSTLLAHLEMQIKTTLSHVMVAENTEGCQTLTCLPDFLLWRNNSPVTSITVFRDVIPTKSPRFFTACSTLCVGLQQGLVYKVVITLLYSRYKSKQFYWFYTNTVYTLFWILHLLSTVNVTVLLRIFLLTCQ